MKRKSVIQAEKKHCARCRRTMITITIYQKQGSPDDSGTISLIIIIIKTVKQELQVPARGPFSSVPSALSDILSLLSARSHRPQKDRCSHRSVCSARSPLLCSSSATHLLYSHSFLQISVQASPLCGSLPA